MAGAQSAPGYPNKAVRILVGYPPGAGSDIVTRLLTPELTKAFGQQFVVDNRPGAAGNIAMELAARTPPDGYTLVNVPASIAISQSLHKKPPFDLMKDFDALALKASVPFALVAFAKARPGQLTYASTGTGSSPHLTGEMLKMHTGIDILHVPTMMESGNAGFESGTWYVLSSPAGLPREVVQRLNSEINRIVQLPDVREKLAALGADPMNGTPDQPAAFLRSEIAKWAKVVKASGTRTE